MRWPKIAKVFVVFFTKKKILSPLFLNHRKTAPTAGFKRPAGAHRPVMLQITDSLIRSTVSAATYAAGQAYMKDGRVRDLRAEPEKNRLLATVKGSGTATYRQTILVESRAGRPVVNGACSCPVAWNCKHVAAVLLCRMNDQEALPSPGEDDGDTKAAADKPATMAPPLAAWLRALAAEANAESEEYPAGITKRLFYFLGRAVPANSAAGTLTINLALTDVKRDGGMGPKFTSPDSYKLQRTEPSPKYLRPSDRTILRAMAGYQIDEFRADPVMVLRQILATGRARAGDYPGEPVKLGPARPATLEWIVKPDGTQRPSLVVEGGGESLLLPVPWYLNPATAEIGPITIDMAPNVLRRVMNAPHVPPEQAGAVRSAIGAALPAARVPLPRELPHGGTLKGMPTAHLRLRRLNLPYQDGPDRFGAAAALLSFRYDPALVPADTTLREFVQDGRRYNVVRDAKSEKALTAVLDRMGFLKIRQVMPYGLPPEDRDLFVLQNRTPEARWLDFVLDDIPMLRGLGWEIELAPDFPHRVVTATGTVQAGLRETTGIDWFDLDLGVLVGEERVNLVPPLVKMLSSPHAAKLVADMQAEGDDPKRKITITLMDGRRLLLPAATIRPIIISLFDLIGAGGVTTEAGRLGVTKTGAADIAALEQASLSAGVVWKGGDALRALGRQLQQRGGINEAVIPKWFAADLRDYQRRGVDWLQFLREAGLAGILADDMGLGKTVQTLAHICIEKQTGRLKKPVLVVCPTSVVGNWAREAARFAPTLRVLPLQGTDRKSRFDGIAGSDIVISTYPLLSRDDEILTAQDWHMLILDEAQTVKNPAATMAQAVRRLRAGQRICLTGTPMENHLGELWALFDFMMPGFLGSQAEFTKRFRNPIEKAGNADLHAALAHRVAPFLLRRNKSEVAKELPPRTDIVETVQMEPPQRAIYEAIRLAMHTRVQAAIAEQGLGKSGIVILDALLKLRQACCDPRLLKMAGTTKQKSGSAKLERLMDMLETLLEEGRAILIFSQFTSMLSLIQEAVTALNIPYALLTGETRDRAKPVDDFQAGRVKLFLISLKAGGVGLNLTAADTVIHYDPWWNPAVENQATDRAHRIGQTKSVFVHRLITEDSIEEKMEVLKSRKSALAEGILSGAGAAALKMTQDDVEMLFS
jgi:superfamily II DNA or RNA helicase